MSLNPLHENVPKKETLSLHLHGLIKEEILSRLPVKALLRFRCVSKTWRSLIDSNRFIKKHLHNYTNKTTDCDRWKTIWCCRKHELNQHGSKESSYYSFWNEPLLEPSPINDPKNQHLMSGSVVDRCNGLLCIFKKPFTFFLWNPATKISFELPETGAQNLAIGKLGFGWDEESDAYKVFVAMSDQNTNEVMAQVYSSKTNSWKRVECGSLDLIAGTGTFACGKIHWLAQSGGKVCIESFDLKREVFGTTELPRQPERGVQIWLLEVMGSLYVLSKIVGDNSKCRVWVMEESVDNDNDGKRDGRKLREPWAEMIWKLARPRCCTAIFYSESLVSPLLFNKRRTDPKSLVSPLLFNKRTDPRIDIRFSCFIVFAMFLFH